MAEKLSSTRSICTIYICLYTFSLLLCQETSAQESIRHKKYEYKHSFKGPHLVQADMTVPYWALHGDSVAGDDKIRIVPSIRDKKGLAWSTTPFESKEWEIEAHIRIEGRGRLGADGLALWYTSHNGELGTVYGAKDQWEGLGVFLDSFDNDNKLDNPSILVVTNDGTQQYQHDSDGLNQHSGSCRFDFRNKPYPVKVKIRYEGTTLTVSYTSGNFADDSFFQTCTIVENVNLPTYYYFGVSAATGGLADDHDVIKFLTSSLIETRPEVPDSDEQKGGEEYEKNMEEFNKMQEEYEKEHPDSQEEKLQSEELYEGTASKELISIFEIQSNLKEELRSVSSMLQELLDHQRGMSSKLDVIQSRPVDVPEGQAAPAAGADNNAKTYHIDNVMNLQREAYDTVKGLRHELNLMKQMLNQISQQTQRAETGGGAPRPAGDTYEAIQFRQTVQSDLSKIGEDVGTIIRKQANAPKPMCPEPEMPSCVSVGIFVAIAVVQLVIIIAYQSMRMSREDAAKKFF